MDLSWKVDHAKDSFQGAWNFLLSRHNQCCSSSTYHSLYRENKFEKFIDHGWLINNTQKRIQTKTTSSGDSKEVGIELVEERHVLNQESKRKKPITTKTTEIDSMRKGLTFEVVYCCWRRWDKSMAMASESFWFSESGSHLT